MVSIDLELAWGFNYELLEGSKTSMKYLKIIIERSRHNVRKLLDLSEQFNVPFTWGIVGHLFLSSCYLGKNGVPHPDMPRPSIDLVKDWYSNDPCSNVKNDPAWYGSDIIKQILESRIEQDIACHSFSHVDFSKCSREVALAEVKKCKEVMKDYGVAAKSFIFPKNRISHLDVLRQEGFKIFRFKVKRTPPLFTTLQETMFPTTDSLVYADGLFGVSSSLLFQHLHEIDDLRLQIATLMGIKKAINQRKIFHIRMHDYLESENLFEVLLKILKYVTKLREQNKLETKTMCSLYQEYIAHSDYFNYLGKRSI